MPMDVRCPGCESTFPVTEAATASAVQCPYCEHEFTASLNRSAAGSPPPTSQLAGAPKKPDTKPAKKPSGTTKPAPRRRRDDDDEGDDLSEKDRLRERRGQASGSGMMLVVAGAGLLVVLGGLGGAAYLLFSGGNKNTADAPTNSGNTTAKATNSNTNPRPETPRPGTPQPKTPRTTPRAAPNTPEPVDPDPIPGTPSPAPKQPEPPPAPPRPSGVRLTPIPGSPFDITPPTLAGESGPVTVELGGRAETALVAGGGRFVVVHLLSERKLVLFDVNEGRLTREAQLDPDPDARVAAGMNTLAVVYPTRRVVHGYGVANLTREATGTLQGGGMVSAAAMGSATNGPLFLVSAGQPSVSLYDLAAMRGIDGSGGSGLPLPVQPVTQARVAANGSLFTIVTPLNRLGPATVLRVQNGEWKGQRMTTALLAPGPSGEVVYGGGEMFTPEGKPTGPKVGRTGQAVWRMALP
jgi:hypothetical protein